MKRSRILGLTSAVAIVGLPIAAASPAFAADGAQSYQANLAPVPLNGQNSASATLMLTLTGNTATITEDAHGLAASFQGGPFPHVQHIHGLAQGTCPTASADADGNGVISTGEAQSSYGDIQTTLSTSGDTSPAAGTDVKIAPSGSSFHYSRTITLSNSTVQAITNGNAVIVIHGLDPATAPSAAGSEKSKLVPSLPLAATAPALCGKLVSAQLGSVPTGGAATGGGSTAGVTDPGLLALGVTALAGAGGAMAYRRFSTARR